MAAEAYAREWIDAWNSLNLKRILSHYAEDVVFKSPRVQVRRVDGQFWQGAPTAPPPSQYLPHLRARLLISAQEAPWELQMECYEAPHSCCPTSQVGRWHLNSMQRCPHAASVLSVITSGDSPRTLNCVPSQRPYRKFRGYV